MNGPTGDSEDREWRRLCRIGGISALVLFAYCVMTLIVLVTIGRPPTTAEETYTLLRTSRLIGLLRLDLLTVVFMPAYYVLFAGLYAALRRAGGQLAALTTALAYVGVTLFLATPSTFSMVHLSERHEAATTDAQRSLLVAAGEAIIASDMWHGTGAVVGGILVTCAGVMISVIMLQSKDFSTSIAYVGLATNALDLAHTFLGLWLPAIGVVLMAIAGVLYLFWFPLVGRRLYQLGRVAERAFPSP